MKAIAFDTIKKTFAVVDPDTAKKMLYCGNPHGFNRATEFPDSGLAGMVEVMKANGFKMEGTQP